jgi:hypothetical protein
MASRAWWDNIPMLSGAAQVKSQDRNLMPRKHFRSQIRYLDKSSHFYLHSEN